MDYTYTRPSGDVMAGMAEDFMRDWTSNIFRDRCLAQIEGAKSESNPREYSDDGLEKFLAEKTSRELEEFVFSKTDTREDYLSLIAEMIMSLRRYGRQQIVNYDVLESASPEELVNGGLHNGIDHVDELELNGASSVTKSLQDRNKQGSGAKDK